MATRDLTRRFKQLREQHRPYILGQKSDSNNMHGRLLEPEEKEPVGWSTDVTVETGPVPSLPPIWVDHLDQIDATLNTIEKDIEKLKRQQKERLKFRFDDERTDQDREIEVLTQSITQSFARGNNLLKRIATAGNENGNLPYEERVLRVNVMRAKATRSQELSRRFREHQNQFLRSLQKGNKGDQYFDDETTHITLDDVGRGFTEEQMAQININAQDADQREKEIIGIAKSVNDLAQLFNELNVLVVQQGTVLDRIDYNIEQTVGQLRQAGQEIKKAEQYQKRSRSTMCIIVLLVLIIICACILVFKNL